MKFDWSGYLDLAKELAVINTSDAAKIVEAKLRSSISRAYYAAFCLPRNYLRDYLEDPRLSKARSDDVNEHQYVAQEFKNYDSRNKKMIEIGKNLSRLRALRNKADYDDVFSDRINKLQNEVNFCLTLAENIITNINELIEDT